MPRPLSDFMGLEHTVADRHLVDRSGYRPRRHRWTSAEAVDHRADARRIRVTAGTHSADRLGGGPVVTGIGEDEDEALTDIDRLRAPGLEADRGGFGHCPGIDAAWGGPWATASAACTISWRASSSKTVAWRFATARATDVATAALDPKPRLWGIAERMSSSTSASGSPTPSRAAVEPGDDGTHRLRGGQRVPGEQLALDPGLLLR